jgi:hypothetical protein
MKRSTKEQKAAQLVRQGAAISLVHDSEFRKLIEDRRPARIADRIAGEPVEWLALPTKKQFIQVAKIKGPLDREHSVLGRVEQSYLRRILFNGAEHADCWLCGRSLPVRGIWCDVNNAGTTPSMLEPVALRHMF